MKIENSKVFNFDGAFRGMRNPLESWDKSDSEFLIDLDMEDSECNGLKEVVCLGEADLKLAQKLIRAGSCHAKFMRQIFVSVDITGPLYW